MPPAPPSGDEDREEDRHEYFFISSDWGVEVAFAIFLKHQLEEYIEHEQRLSSFVPFLSPFDHGVNGKYILSQLQQYRDKKLWELENQYSHYVVSLEEFVLVLAQDLLVVHYAKFAERLSVCEEVAREVVRSHVQSARRKIHIRAHHSPLYRGDCEICSRRRGSAYLVVPNVYGLNQAPREYNEQLRRHLPDPSSSSSGSHN